jgi:hypothetical protein
MVIFKALTHNVHNHSVILIVSVSTSDRVGRVTTFITKVS